MSQSYQYFKGQCNPKYPCYYRVSPDDTYEYFYNGVWHPGGDRSWEHRFNRWQSQPIEVSKLEVLVVLGPEVIEEEL